MLTKKQVMKIADSEWDIILKRGYHPLRYQGWHLPDLNESRIYLPKHKDKDDLAITIIHELIHARNDERKAARVRKTKDNEIEEEAKETYKRNPKLFDFIKELYQLNI